jgi:hypothetical protein
LEEHQTFVFQSHGEFLAKRIEEQAWACFALGAEAGGLKKNGENEVLIFGEDTARVSTFGVQTWVEEKKKKILRIIPIEK